MARQEAQIPEWLEAYMARQQQQLESLQEQHQAQIQALQNAIAQTNETVRAAQRPTVETAPEEVQTPPTPTPTPIDATNVRPARRRAILPDPPKFDGSRGEYEGWRSLMNDKIDVDGEVIGSHRNQFIYVASRLEGKGLQSALTFTTLHRDAPNASAALLVNYLDGIFGDRHKAQRAVETLRTLKQGPREPFSAFLPRFEKTLADAGGMAWPDAVKRSHLDGTLTFELRRLMITMPVATSYSNYVDELLRISDLYRATMRNAPREQQMAQGAMDRMDWEPTRAAPAAPTSQRTRRRAMWVSPEERRKRIEKGLCIRCGASGHHIAQCEFRSACPPENRGPRAAPGRVEWAEPQLEPEPGPGGPNVEMNSRAEELN